MVERPILAVDVGTGSARALLFDLSGDLHGTFKSPIHTYYPRTGWAEQDPTEILDAVSLVVRAAVEDASAAGGIAAVSFSSQMYSVLGTDRSGQPLTMCLPWTDSRAVEEADRLRTQAPAGELASTTGCPLRATYPLAKVRWLKDNQALPNDTLFVSIKDYVIWKLTSVLAADRSSASASGMLDIAGGVWSARALELAGLGLSNLPELYSPRTLVPLSTGSILHEMGIPAGTPIVLGAGDAVLSSVGSGAVGSDLLAINLGTSAAARRMIDRPLTDPSERLWTYIVDDDHWVTGGIVGSAGLAYDWALDLVFGERTDEAYERAADLVGSVAPGADGLTFLPYVSGEQSPAWRPSARGTLAGIEPFHDKRHLLRAVTEGLVFALQRVRQAIEETTGEGLREVTVTGGLCRSAVAMQIIADVLGLPVVVPASHEGSGWGAAIFGWLALGALPDLDTGARQTLAGRPRIAPSPQAHSAYRDRFDDFVRLADRMAPERAGLAS